MASPVAFAVDDKDLDDAALWAVIDSAVASHSTSNSRKPLAIKQGNFHAGSPKFHTPSPPIRNYKSPRVHYSPSEGEVVQEPYGRPQKMARTSCGSEMSETSPMAVVRHVQRTPVGSPVYNSSPEIGRVCVRDISGASGMENASVKGNEEKGIMRHSLSGMFPSVALFKEYQNAAMAILEKGDYTMISGNPFIKKSGWRKISFYFNLSYEIKDKTIEFDENRNVQRAEFVVRAHMQGGRFSDGWGSCERREKRFLKPNHDIPSTAETRAKNKACQDLLGIGEYRPGASHANQK